MKKIVVASAVMAAAAMADNMDARPAASVSTPVERNAALGGVPSLSENENMEWQKMREERRAARELILQNLRENSSAEKNAAREKVDPVSASEKRIENLQEAPKEDLLREQKLEENRMAKNPMGVSPVGGPLERGNNRRGWIPPQRPFEPRLPEKGPKADFPKRPDLIKDIPSRP